MKDLNCLKAPTSAAVLGMLLVIGLPLAAQVTSGNLSGTVYDPSGASVAGASLKIQNQATGLESSTQSGSSGEYRFDNLPVGTYNIIVSFAGFSTTEVKNVSVQLNQTITQNVTLSVNRSTTTVEVSEAAASIDTTTAQLQTTFETKQIADLPTTSGGSGVLNLALLNPGVGTSGAVGAGTGPSVAGQRPPQQQLYRRRRGQQQRQRDGSAGHCA